MSTVVCKSCGETSPDRFRVCPMCGTPFAAPAPAREERKVVTVLFCDLVGFTQRSETMDPEDVRALLRGYHEHLRGELERFGGTVEKFIGDAVVALFGAPTAHEDDPERAVRAALAIRDWAREQDGLEVRIAVTTGESLVTLDAQPERGEGMVAGDVVNTAARLQAAAPANGILVGETTYRATRERIDYVEHSSVAAKGKSEPISVWEAVAARSPAGVDVRDHSAAPLVGRDRELRLVVDLLDRVREERSPQLLTLVGAPGLGKSRLVHELLLHVDTQPELVTWRHGRSLPYGGGSFAALAEIVKAEIGALESDSPDAVSERLHAAVDALLGDDLRVEAHLGSLLGLEIDGRLHGERDDAFAAWRRFLEALAEPHPLVLVFDDLQWADDGLLDFVDHLVDWASGVPLLVVATARPELLDRRPGWGGGKLNASTLALSALSDADAARLIAALLERTLLAADDQSALLDRVGGNPLYAEQYSLLYREGGTAVQLRLPEGVQGTIAARLDLLDTDEKAVLQDAAVVGKVFWPGALGRDAASLTRTLHGLERKDFVFRERRSSVEGQGEYAFRHLLVRDVAYDQIPRAARAERHRRTAAWIEQLSSRRADHDELVADHRLQALELGRAAGDTRPDDEANAVAALRRAGDRAFSLFAFARAERAYERALELSPDSAERPRLLLAYGRALQGQRDERGTAVLAEARDLLAAQGNVQSAAEAEGGLAELLFDSGDGVAAAEHARRAVELLRDSPPSFAKAYVLSSLSRILTFTGELEGAATYAEQAAAISGELGFDEVLAHALDNLGTAKALLGDRGGLQDLERSIRIAVEMDSPEALRAYNNLAGLLDSFGDRARAEGVWREGREVAERLGIPMWVERLGPEDPLGLFLGGRWDALLERLDRGEDVDPTLQASVRLGRGDLDGALADSRRALEGARRLGRPDELALSLSLLVEVLRARGEDETPELDELVELLPAFAPWAGSFSVIGFTVADAGRGDALVAALETVPASPSIDAQRLYASGDLAGAEALAETEDPLIEAVIRLRVGRQLAARGQWAEADVHLHKALAFFRNAGATFYVREAESLLAKTA